MPSSWRVVFRRRQSFHGLHIPVFCYRLDKGVLGVGSDWRHRDAVHRRAMARRYLATIHCATIMIRANIMVSGQTKLVVIIMGLDLKVMHDTKNAVFRRRCRGWM